MQDALDDLAEEATDSLFAYQGDEDMAAQPILRRNVARGGVAIRRLERIFRRRGYQTQREVPVIYLNRQGLPELGRVDLLPVARRGTHRTAPYAYESKFIDLARYRLAGGGLDFSRLRSAINQHVAQALRYQEGLRSLNQQRRARNLTAVPERVRLIYQVPHQIPRTEAAAFQRLATSVANPRGIPITVIVPGSRASRAFEAE